LGFGGSRLEELDVVIFLSSTERVSLEGGRNGRRSHSGHFVAAVSYAGRLRRRGGEVKKPRTPVLFLREGVRECYPPVP